MVIWFLNVKLTMVAWFNLTIWPWSTMVQPWSKHCQTMVDHGSAMFIPQRHINLNVCSHQVIYLTWLTIRSLMICECGTDHGWPWSDHGQNIARPWLTMVWPCSSSRGMLIWMLQHIKYLTTCHWSNGHLIFEYGTDHGWPWSDHGCLILPDHGQPWLTMVRPCSSPRGQCWFEYLHLIYQVFDHDWPDNGHLIFECGTDHGWPWLTMVRSWLPDHGQIMVAWPWSTMVEPWSKHCQTMFTLQRYVDLNVCTSSTWPWSKPCHLIFECGTDHGRPWLPDHGQPWLNHGQNIARPWSTMVWPCSPFRGMLIWMSPHQVFDHDANHVIWFLNVELTMVDHGQTMVAWPWSTMVGNGGHLTWPWSTMVQPWSKHCQTMVNHGHWPWSNHGSTMVDHGLTMFIPQGRSHWDLRLHLNHWYKDHFLSIMYTLWSWLKSYKMRERLQKSNFWVDLIFHGEQLS